MRKGLLILVAALIAAMPAGASSTKHVAVKDDFFSPKSITIAKGTKVVWTWKGKHKHNVSEANDKFGSTTKRKGTYSHTFKKKGKYLIFCTIHAPDMQMKITVK